MDSKIEMRQIEREALRQTLGVAVPAGAVMLAAAVDIPSWPAPAALVQHPHRDTLTLVVSVDPAKARSLVGSLLSSERGAA